MDRTRPAELVPGSFAGREAIRSDFSQGVLARTSAKEMPGMAESRGCQGRRRLGRHRWEQRRGIRNLFI